VTAELQRRLAHADDLEDREEAQANEFEAWDWVMSEIIRQVEAESVERGRLAALARAQYLKLIERLRNLADMWGSSDTSASGALPRPRMADVGSPDRQRCAGKLPLPRNECGAAATSSPPRRRESVFGDKTRAAAAAKLAGWKEDLEKSSVQEKKALRHALDYMSTMKTEHKMLAADGLYHLLLPDERLSLVRLWMLHLPYYGRLGMLEDSLPYIIAHTSTKLRLEALRQAYGASGEDAQLGAIRDFLKGLPPQRRIEALVESFSTTNSLTVFSKLFERLSANEKRSVVALLFRGDVVISESTGLPLFAPEESQAQSCEGTQALAPTAGAPSGQKAGAAHASEAQQRTLAASCGAQALCDGPVSEVATSEVAVQTSIGMAEFEAALPSCNMPSPMEVSLHPSLVLEVAGRASPALARRRSPGWGGQIPSDDSPSSPQISTPSRSDSPTRSPSLACSQRARDFAPRVPSPISNLSRDNSFGIDMDSLPPLNYSFGPEYERLFRPRPPPLEDPCTVEETLALIARVLAAAFDGEDAATAFGQGSGSLKFTHCCINKPNDFANHLWRHVLLQYGVRSQACRALWTLLHSARANAAKHPRIKLFCEAAGLLAPSSEVPTTRIALTVLRVVFGEGQTLRERLVLPLNSMAICLESSAAAEMRLDGGIGGIAGHTNVSWGSVEDLIEELEPILPRHLRRLLEERARMRAQNRMALGHIHASCISRPDIAALDADELLLLALGVARQFRQQQMDMLRARFVAAEIGSKGPVTIHEFASLVHSFSPDLPASDARELYVHMVELAQQHNANEDNIAPSTFASVCVAHNVLDTAIEAYLENQRIADSENGLR